jgi:hypothetical protein
VLTKAATGAKYRASTTCQIKSEGNDTEMYDRCIHVSASQRMSDGHRLKTTQNAAKEM